MKEHTNVVDFKKYSTQNTEIEEVILNKRKEISKDYLTKLEKVMEKITPYSLDSILFDLELGTTNKEIAEEMGISSSYFGRIYNKYFKNKLFEEPRRVKRIRKLPSNYVKSFSEIANSFVLDSILQPLVKYNLEYYFVHRHIGYVKDEIVINNYSCKLINSLEPSEISNTEYYIFNIKKTIISDYDAFIFITGKTKNEKAKKIFRRYILEPQDILDNGTEISDYTIRVHIPLDLKCPTCDGENKYVTFLENWNFFKEKKI